MIKTPSVPRTYYEKHFEELGKSPIQIAEELGVYPNKVRRELSFYGFKLRSKSEAQVNALRTGRHKHPTEGKKRTRAEKNSISEGVAVKWKNLSPETRERHKELSKLNWENMTDDQRESFQTLASAGVRKAATEGSKLEKFLRDTLPLHSFEVIFHDDKLIPNEKLEVDLHVPGANTVIEVDGPTHFLPIWGEENLEKHQERDEKKNSLLLSYGFNVLRIKYLAKSLSETHKRDVLRNVLDTLKKIKGNVLPSIVEITVE